MSGLSVRDRVAQFSRGNEELPASAGPALAENPPILAPQPRQEKRDAPDVRPAAYLEGLPSRTLPQVPQNTVAMAVMCAPPAIPPKPNLPINLITQKMAVTAVGNSNELPVPPARSMSTPPSQALVKLASPDNVPPQAPPRSARSTLSQSSSLASFSGVGELLTAPTATAAATTAQPPPPARGIPPPTPPRRTNTGPVAASRQQGVPITPSPTHSAPVPIPAPRKTPEEVILDISPATFDSVVLDATKHVFVDFTADWCEPCQRFMPIFEVVAKSYIEEPMVIFARLKINTFEDELVNRYNLTGVPSLLYFPPTSAKTPEKYLGSNYGEGAPQMLIDFVGDKSGIRRMLGGERPDFVDKYFCAEKKAHAMFSATTSALVNTLFGELDPPKKSAGTAAAAPPLPPPRRSGSVHSLPPSSSATDLVARAPATTAPPLSARPGSLSSVGPTSISKSVGVLSTTAPPPLPPRAGKAVATGRPWPVKAAPVATATLTTATSSASPVSPVSGTATVVARSQSNRSPPSSARTMPPPAPRRGNIPMNRGSPQPKAACMPASVGSATESTMSTSPKSVSGEKRFVHAAIPRIPADLRSRYEELYATLAKEHEFAEATGIPSTAVVPVWRQSQLSLKTLADLWDALYADGGTARVTNIEFCVGMWFIDRVLAGERLETILVHEKNTPAI